MRTLAICTAALITILSVAPTAWAQEAAKDKTAPRQRAPRPDFDRRAEQGQAAQKLQSQIEELQAAHQKLATELRAIHAAALKEKATGTAALVQKLINDRQQALQQDIHRLELQQQRLLQAAGENATRGNDIKPQARPAPDFAVPSFEGKAVKLADYKDKIVVLEWLNTDCPFVQYHYDKAGTMVELARKYQDKNVVWLAINSTHQTTPEANREFAKKHKLPYPILDDRSGQVGRLYGAVTTPHVFIINKGVVVYDGAIDNAPNGTPLDGGAKVGYVDKALSELTSGQPVSTPRTQSYGCSVKYPSQIPAEPKTQN